MPEAVCRMSAASNMKQCQAATAEEGAPIPLLELGEDYWIDRGRFLADAYARIGPVFRARHLKTEVVFLIGPAANRFVLATARAAFSHFGGWSTVFGGSGEPRNLLTMDPPEHDFHRRIVAPAFGASRLLEYQPLIVRVTERRLARWAARAEIDAYEEARIIAFDLALRAFLGAHPGPEVELGRAVYLHGAGARTDAFTALLRRKIAERRNARFDDALGLLAAARDPHGFPLSDEQILAHAEILLVAGYETTASLGAWALYLLASQPQYTRRLRAELEDASAGAVADAGQLQARPLLDNFILEAERLFPPVPTAPRRLLRPVVFAGYHIPAGTLVLYSAAGTHMLEDVWTAPEGFDPDRFAPPRAEHRRTAYALVGFGGGPRTCIGQPFARMQLRTVLATASRLFDLTPVPGQVLRQRYGVTARPLHGIRLQVAARSHGPDPLP